MSAAVVAASEALGPDHPDTAVYRAALRDACGVGAARGRKRDLAAVEAARELLSDEAAPTEQVTQPSSFSNSLMSTTTGV